MKHLIVASLPPEMLLDKGFHSDTISAAHPRLAAIPYSVPQRRRAMLERMMFSARVGWYGLVSRQSRVDRMTRLAAHTLHCAFSSTHRKRHAVIGPVHLLYFFHLSDTIRTLMGRSRTFEASGARTAAPRQRYLAS